ncbi:rho GTPase-activating protein 11A isoform 1-T1 [Menidia menidia]
MKVVEKNIMRLVAVQHLRTAYGIKTKNWNKNKAASCKSTASNSTKVFGVPLDGLPYYNMECGSVPSFLVDACMKLLAHVDTEGLFRKSGSVVRLKALRAKLDAGEECLSTALPCDVAGLVKQFFRELPEPVLPAELQDAFIKAQQLPTEEDKTSATMLLTCVLPDRNISLLRHFFDFLQNVSQRSAENKMDSSNLSLILAPNLLHFGDGSEKMNATTEKRLKLQAAIVHCFIENAPGFGVLPQFLREKIPTMMGCESGVPSPSQDELEELEINSGMKRKNRRSFGDMVNGALNKIKTNRTPTNASQADSVVFTSATPVIATPSSKRKLPLESGHSFGFSNKKLKSVKKSLGIELLPNTLFSGASTPGSACSASGVLDSSQNALLSAGRSRRQSVTSVRRKSKRLSSRHAVNRVESGRAGCFSPKVSKKEAPRKSLRLRFSLGKSSKDAGSESIGLRLATQESTNSFHFTKEFSPSVLPRKTEPKCSKFISKSEDNLLTPQCDSTPHLASWIADTPVGAQTFRRGSATDTPMAMCLKNSYASEPAIVPHKPPAAAGRPIKLCCASSAESLESDRSISGSQTLLKIHTDSTELRSGAQAGGGQVMKPSNGTPYTPTLTAAGTGPDTSSCPAQQRFLANDQNVTFGQIEMAGLTPLHIDSVMLESSTHSSPVVKEGVSAQVSDRHALMMGHDEEEAEQVNSSRLIDALDIQSPSHFRLGVYSGLQSTPYKLQPEDQADTPTKTNKSGSQTHEKTGFSPGLGPKVQNLSPSSQEAEKRRVAEHIQHFNQLTIYSPPGSKSKRIRSPLKFQRTPVRQTVRRINSLLGESSRPGRKSEFSACQTAHVAKAVSLESGLSPHPGPPNRRGSMKKPPPVPPKKPSTLARKPALGDMTNRVQAKAKTDRSASEPTRAQKPLVQEIAEKDMNHYRGSPRNPLNQARLLSATKPIDL